MQNGHLRLQAASSLPVPVPQTNHRRPTRHSSGSDTSMGSSPAPESAHSLRSMASPRVLLSAQSMHGSQEQIGLTFAPAKPMVRNGETSYEF